MAKKLQKNQKERLFEETLVPAKSGSDRLFDVSYGYEAPKPVECLGLTFPSDEARRLFFTEKLRDKLKDPAFRKIEGFPIGEDEDILALSDPPYYTACPNPWLEQFVRSHSSVSSTEDSYQADPFASDVTEGKQDAICMAHTYHTKVPYRAIARYLLHYTRPGDLVLDTFAGTGMLGVAAALCASPDSEFKSKVETEWKLLGQKPQWGQRYVLLNDLSPFATFLCRCFNSCLPTSTFDASARRLISTSRQDLSWVALPRLKCSRKLRCCLI
jgi:hypothetical protein